MTQDDIDAQVGKTDRQLREADKRLAALQAKARHLGSVTERLSTALRHPDSIVFEHQEFDQSLITLGKTNYFTDKDFAGLDAGTLRELGDSIRHEIKQIQELGKELRRLRGEVA
ncbi:MAG: hypothetical protein ABSA78_17325 [Candidatus Sulfotelmatobacter sp.]